jgi:hypothetical protein
MWQPTQLAPHQLDGCADTQRQQSRRSQSGKEALAVAASGAGHSAIADEAKYRVIDNVVKHFEAAKGRWDTGPRPRHCQRRARHRRGRHLRRRPRLLEQAGRGGEPGLGKRACATCSRRPTRSCTRTRMLESTTIRSDGDARSAYGQTRHESGAFRPRTSGMTSTAEVGLRVSGERAGRSSSRGGAGRGGRWAGGRRDGRERRQGR